jgi:hypothetical protein
MTIERPLQHKTKRRDKDTANRKRQQERNAKPVHEGHGRVAAKHGEHAVRKINETHQPHRYREPDGDQV